MEKIPKNKWIYNWGIDKLNAKYLYNHIQNTKPEVIIETGTFQAQGTYIMANSANNNNNNCKIYTIDYNGDPTTELEKEKWLDLKKIRDENLKIIENKFPNVKVIYLDGDSRIILKTLFKKYNIKKCDLFYQDSMHFIEGIKEEWKLVEKYIHQNSYIIFDDLSLKGVRAFRDWFKNMYKHNYKYNESLIGHKQFIVKKI